MLPYLLPVQPEFAGVVHRSEMQQHVFTKTPQQRHTECAAIPEGVLGIKPFAHSAQRRFQSERHEYLPRRNRHLGNVVRSNRIIPETVEILPASAYHLRTGVFGKGVFRRDFGGPAGADVLPGGLPSGSGCKYIGRKSQDGKNEYSLHRLRRYEKNVYLYSYESTRIPQRRIPYLR